MTDREFQVRVLQGLQEIGEKVSNLETKVSGIEGFVEEQRDLGMRI